MIVKSFSDLEEAFIYVQIAKQLGMGCVMSRVFWGGIRININGTEKEKKDFLNILEVIDREKFVNNFNVLLKLVLMEIISIVNNGK